MARKPSKPSGASDGANRPPTPPTNIRMPSFERIVTSRRNTPEIRLSGAWLERVGFPKGMPFVLMSNSDYHEIVLRSLIGLDKKVRRRR